MASKKSTPASKSPNVKDLVVKKSGEVRGGKDPNVTQLSGPYDDRVGSTFTSKGDPGR